MADYAAFPLWNGRGASMIRPDEMPLSAELRADLQAWNDEWDRTLTSNAYEVPAAWDQDPWHERGQELARRVAAELGDEITVLYFDARTGERQPVTPYP